MVRNVEKQNNSFISYYVRLEETMVPSYEGPGIIQSGYNTVSS